jgi:hypothetical protein
MSGPLFGRQAAVLIDELDTTGLRIKFKIEKSLVGYPNLGLITVYNLSESSREKLTEEGLKIELYAGYTDVALLFSGNIINALHVKEGVDWLSNIYAGDAIKDINDATINKTLAAGSTPAQIFNTLVGEMQGVTKGLTEGLSNCLTGKQSLLRGLQLTGNVKDLIQKLADD